MSAGPGARTLFWARSDLSIRSANEPILLALGAGEATDDRVGAELPHQLHRGCP